MTLDSRHPQAHRISLCREAGGGSGKQACWDRTIDMVVMRREGLEEMDMPWMLLILASSDAREARGFISRALQISDRCKQFLYLCTMLVGSG